jgi:hypothetical protein
VATDLHPNRPEEVQSSDDHTVALLGSHNQGTQIVDNRGLYVGPPLGNDDNDEGSTRDNDQAPNLQSNLGQATALLELIQNQTSLPIDLTYLGDFNRGFRLVENTGAVYNNAGDKMNNTPAQPVQGSENDTTQQQSNRSGRRIEVMHLGNNNRRLQIGQNSGRVILSGNR